MEDTSWVKYSTVISVLTGVPEYKFYESRDLVSLIHSCLRPLEQGWHIVDVQKVFAEWMDDWVCVG